MLASAGTISSGITDDALDSDASAFISAAGIANIQQRYAINKIVLQAKGHGWWTLCNAIYPMVGGAATTHKFNLKDPQNTDAAFRLDFQGGWTHGETGATPNGTTGYANTFLNPSTVLPLNDNHISIYSRTNSGAGVVEIGSQLDNNHRILLALRDSDFFRTDMYDLSTSRISAANTDSTGWYLGSRRSSSDLEAYKNGASVGTSSGAPNTIPAYTIYLGALNAVDVAAAFSSKEIAFATIGSGITSAIAALMYQDIQNFQSRLNRAVW